MTLFIADKNRVSLLLQRKDKNTPKGLCYKKRKLIKNNTKENQFFILK